MDNVWQVQDAKARFSEFLEDERGRRTANRHETRRADRCPGAHRTVGAGCRVRRSPISRNYSWRANRGPRNWPCRVASSAVATRLDSTRGDVPARHERRVRVATQPAASAVLEWIRNVPAERLHLSAVTVGEIQGGIEKTRAHDSAKARMLRCARSGHDGVPDPGSGRRDFPGVGKLMHRQSVALSQDATIAAVARIHGLTVVSRNVRDFEQFGVEILDPFAAPAS